MPSIVVGMEPNQVAMQDTEQQLVPDWENSVDLAAREGRMEEEADLDILLAIADLLTQHLREEHQVIIMHPDQVAILNFLRNRFGEKTVGLLVCFPGGLVKGNLTGMVMEEGPENGVCEQWISVSKQAPSARINEGATITDPRHDKQIGNTN